MATLSNILSKKTSSKYYCEKCDYSTNKKSNYNTHTDSKKHNKQQLELKINDNKPNLSSNKNNTYCNVCEKNYKDRTGLWRHKKKCVVIDGININDKDSLVIHLLQQNRELQKSLIELSREKIITNSTHSNNTNNSHNTNSNNKTFNLNFFLNETCKNAMNISEFVSSIKVTLEELEYTGRQGYIQGISNIILNNLQKLEQHERPLHCNDLKREILYIKENNKWEKETEQKPILTKAIKTIANENIKQIKNWRDKYPDCTDSESKKNNMYLKIVSNSMNGLTEEESYQNIDKIISNVVKEVVIDK
jgi:hypothetical protein